MKNIFGALLIFLLLMVWACDKPNLNHGLKSPNNGNMYVVAHRGAHQGIPENSLPAYREAIRLGVDFVEIDVRTTKDGQFVSVHNREIDAYVPGKSGRIADFTLAELKQFDIGAPVAPEWAGTRIPTFEEILDVCKGKCGIYLDLKDAPVAPLMAMIKARGMEKDVLWYADDNELSQVRELCATCVIMPDPGPEENLAGLIEKMQPQVIASVWRFYSKNFVETCHQAGAIVIVDESGPDCWADALTWGTDGIQTDHPAELIGYLQQK